LLKLALLVPVHFNRQSTRLGSWSLGLVRRLVPQIQTWCAAPVHNSAWRMGGATQSRYIQWKYRGACGSSFRKAAHPLPHHGCCTPTYLPAMLMTPNCHSLQLPVMQQSRVYVCSKPCLGAEVTTPQVLGTALGRQTCSHCFCQGPNRTKLWEM
jgi:hypothetical protein